MSSCSRLAEAGKICQVCRNTLHIPHISPFPFSSWHSLKIFVSHQDQRALFSTKKKLMLISRSVLFSTTSGSDMSVWNSSIWIDSSWSFGMACKEWRVHLKRQNISSIQFFIWPVFSYKICCVFFCSICTYASGPSLSWCVLYAAKNIQNSVAVE